MVAPRLQNLFNKIPVGENGKVFILTSLMLGLCAIPVWTKEEKRGHDLFSQERPEAILNSQEKAMKKFDQSARKNRINPADK